MLLAQLSGVSKAFLSDEVLKGVTWQIGDDLKCGLVGENGAGKTTIFRLLTGQLEPDSGDIVIKRGVQIGHIEQELSAPPGSTLKSEALRALEHVHEAERELEALTGELALMDGSGDAAALGEMLERYGHLHDRYEREGGYDIQHRLEEVLDGLSFVRGDLDRPLQEFSGGQKTRAALARVILRRPDLLLLDEPTNHLDIHAIEWLENFLGGYDGAFIVISHDRWLLDRVSREIVELDRGQLRACRGNYSQFLESRELRLEQEWKAWELQQDEIERTEAFIRRNIAGNNTKQAQSRRKMLEKVERLPRPAGRSKVMHLSLPEPERSGRLVLELKKVSKSYGATPVLRDVSFLLQRGDKLGVIGPNGAGKTTLLRLILGQEAWDGGRLRVGSGVQIGYFEQEQTALRGHHSLLDEIWKITPLVPENEVRSFLGGFLFSGDDVLKPLNALSGGERSRLALARIVRERANFLVLDEPTNHLDIPSRAVFEAALTRFEGTVLAVSHDRWFLDRVATQILHIEGGVARLSLGNYTDWKEREDRTSLAESAPAPLAPPSRFESGRPPAEDRHRARQEARADKRDRERRQRAIESLERDIEAREREKSEITARLESDEVRHDHDRIAELGRRFQRLDEEIAELLRRWESAQLHEESHG